jgi:hypothetical protein
MLVLSKINRVFGTDKIRFSGGLANFLLCKLAVLIINAHKNVVSWFNKNYLKQKGEFLVGIVRP